VNDYSQTLGQFFEDLGKLVSGPLQFLAHWLLVIVWIAWWLLGVNWSKVWPVLARGAWMPVVLVLIVAALVWSQIDPSSCSCLGFVNVPNFWWQLGAVLLLAAVTLACGWLQGAVGWTPTEIDLEPHAPPADHAGHGHH
jgi:hypothetical protein